MIERNKTEDGRELARSLRRQVALLAAFLFAASAVLTLARAPTTPRPGAAVLPRISKIPHFEMTDQEGRRVTAEGLRGKVALVDFFYASCATSCPRLTANMLAVYGRIGPGLPVQFVSITLDPANDTPEVLNAYAARYGVSASRWSFLSGRSEDLNRVVIDGFKVHFRRSDPALGLGAIMHGEWFVLVDARGFIRGYYASGDAAARSQLLRDIRALAREEVGST
jgi:protein SCO1/2